MKALFVFLFLLVFGAQLVAQNSPSQIADGSKPLPDYEDLPPEAQSIWNFMVIRGTDHMTIQIPAVDAEFCTGCTLIVYDKVGHRIAGAEVGFRRAADGSLTVRVVADEDPHGKVRLVIWTAGNPKSGMNNEQGRFTFKLPRGKL